MRVLLTLTIPSYLRAELLGVIASDGHTISVIDDGTGRVQFTVVGSSEYVASRVAAYSAAGCKVTQDVLAENLPPVAITSVEEAEVAEVAPEVNPEAAPEQALAEAAPEQTPAEAPEEAAPEGSEDPFAGVDLTPCFLTFWGDDLRAASLICLDVAGALIQAGGVRFAKPATSNVDGVLGLRFESTNPAAVADIVGSVACEWALTVNDKWVAGSKAPEAPPNAVEAPVTSDEKHGKKKNK